MSKTNDKGYFVLELPLKINRSERRILETRFKLACQLYNGLVDVTQKNYNDMLNDEEYKSALENYLSNYKNKKNLENSIKKLDKNSYEYKNLLKRLKDINKNDKELSDYLLSIRKKFGIMKLGKDGFYGQADRMVKHFSKSLDTSNARFLADNLWKAYDKLLFGNGKKIHKKRYNDLNSVGTRQKAGIYFRVNNIDYNKYSYQANVIWGMGKKNGLKELILPVIVDEGNGYEFNALFSEKDGEFVLNNIKCISIVRKFIRGKYKYYVQLTIEGISPKKRFKKSSSSVLNTKGQVGVDIGVSSVAFAGNKHADKKLLTPDKIDEIKDTLKKLSFKMERSLRYNNPQNYNADGTVKKDIKGKDWRKSKNYKKYINKYNDLNRKFRVNKQRYFLNIIQNDLLNLGDIFIVEDMNFDALKKRSKKTEKKKDGTYKSKKRFGKTILFNSPALFISLLEKEACYHGKTLIKVDPKKYKASQYIWTYDINEPHPLSVREVKVISKDDVDVYVDRDILAAFNLQHIDLKNQCYDKESFKDDEEEFLLENAIYKMK